jgi:hypothetical protein
VGIRDSVGGRMDAVSAACLGKRIRVCTEISRQCRSLHLRVVRAGSIQHSRCAPR